MLEISKQDILARMEFDNPWWESEGAEKIAFQETPRRRYFEKFRQAVTDVSVRRAVVLMGPRRVGKTVMIYHCIRALIDDGAETNSILYVSLDTPVYTGLSLEQLVRLFHEKFDHKKQQRLFIFFDEIQYRKDREVHLKSLVDSFPHHKFVGSGSAAAALRLKSRESGAGRFTDFLLPPLTFAEYLNFIGREDELIETGIDHHDRVKWTEGRIVRDIEALNREFVNYLNYGGYPEAVFSPEIRTAPGQYIKSDIIDKVLLRDLPSLYGIDDIQELNRLFATLAYNTAREVNIEGLAQSSGVAKNTIRRYLEYLEAAFLIRRLERIDENARRFRRATHFKVHLANPSMRAALFGQINADSDAMGALTETAIVSQLQHGKPMRLCYARWRSGEIDIVYMVRGVHWPVGVAEVKWSDRHATRFEELDGAVEFAESNKDMEESILVTTRTVWRDEFEYKGVMFEYMPASFYAYLIGRDLLDSMY